jgi:hypothetical protein
MEMCGATGVNLQRMAKYSRKTVLAATDLLENVGHASITRFLLEHGLENENIAGSMRDCASAVARHVLADPERLNEDQQNLTDAVVEDLVNVPGDGKCIAMIAKMIVAERECCPFLTFELIAQPNMGSVIVRVTGPTGAKDFLRTVLCKAESSI